MKTSRQRWTLGAGIAACAILLVFVIARVSSGGTREASEVSGALDLLPPEKLSDHRPAAAPPAAPAPATSKEIDLLDLIQPGRDGIAGSWGFQERALITPLVKWGRLQIPVIPPEEFDLRIRLTRKRGVNSVNLGFLMNGKQGTAVLDGSDGHTSWVDLAGLTMSENPTTVIGRLLKWNKPATVLLSVRKDLLSILVDGKKAMEWKGKPGDLSVTPEFLVPNPRALILGSYETAFRIDELTLIPISGAPTFLQ
jgi:hypothetical protein